MDEQMRNMKLAVDGLAVALRVANERRAELTAAVAKLSEQTEDMARRLVLLEDLVRETDRPDRRISE